MPATPSDTQLVEQAKAGDYNAFDTLVNRYEQRIYRLAMNIVRQRQDAEDVVQASFMKALENLKGFRGEAAFGTWLRRIAVNTALKLLRKRRGFSLEQATEPDETGRIAHPQIIADWREDLEKNIEQRELKKILENAINQLDEKYRLVFVLRDIEELSTAEAAEAMQISQANVKVRLLRARLMLRELLTEAFADPNRVESTDPRYMQRNESTDAQALIQSYLQ